MNCEEVRLRLVDYLDHELAPEAGEPLASHLEACAGCRDFAAGLEKSLAVFQAVASVEPTPGETVFTLPQAEAGPTRFSRRLVGWLALAATLLLLLGAGLYLRFHAFAPTAAVVEPGLRLTGAKLEISLSGEKFVLHGHGISPRNRLDLKL